MVKGKILFDQGHGEDDLKALKKRLPEEGFLYDVTEKTLTENKLRQYTVLVLTNPKKRFSSNEHFNILDYVNAGGGILLTGDYRNHDEYQKSFKSMYPKGHSLEFFTWYLSLCYNLFGRYEYKVGNVEIAGEAADIKMYPHYIIYKVSKLCFYAPICGRISKNKNFKGKDVLIYGDDVIPKRGWIMPAGVAGFLEIGRVIGLYGNFFRDEFIERDKEKNANLRLALNILEWVSEPTLHKFQKIKKKPQTRPSFIHP